MLLITDAGGRQNTCLLGEAHTWRIGRDRNSNIVLLDDAASRRHAIIQRTEIGEYYLMDAGSQNGTFVQGRRVTTPIVLNDGDEISIGGHRSVFRSPIPVIGPAGTLQFRNGRRDGCNPSPFCREAGNGSRCGHTRFHAPHAERRSGDALQVHQPLAFRCVRDLSGTWGAGNSNTSATRS